MLDNHKGVFWHSTFQKFAAFYSSAITISVFKLNSCCSDTHTHVSFQMLGNRAQKDDKKRKLTKFLSRYAHCRLLQVLSNNIFHRDFKKLGNYARANNEQNTSRVYLTCQDSTERSFLLLAAAAFSFSSCAISLKIWLFSIQRNNPLLHRFYLFSQLRAKLKRRS